MMDDGLDQLRYHNRRKLSKGIACFVCNEHNEALLCFHVAIRRKLLSFSNNFLVHIDSHPDLMIPQNLLDADDVFDPQKLYQILEASQGGIAEFIIPAVYQQHINSILWIRPPWSDQIRGIKIHLTFSSLSHLIRWNVLFSSWQRESNE